MKTVFISHPYEDNPEENKKWVDALCKFTVKMCPGILPVSPIHLFSFMDDDCGRKDIMGICRMLIDCCDELWSFGDSEGCAEEMRYAEENGVPVKIMYK